jgi:DNA-binding MarR family transcriptional regulator
VAASEGLTQQACGVALQVPASRMVALVDDLEERGLIERRTNPSDRRARALHVTPAGRRLVTKVTTTVLDRLGEPFDGLSPAEQDELRRMLTVVSGRLGIPPGVHAGMQD